MKPYLHAEKSAKKWGGEPEDYLPIHNFIDSSKAHFPDQRHRALLHNSFGIYLAEQMFGTFIVNSKGKKIQVRDIAEDHVLEDMGFIPTVQDYLQDMPFYNFLDGKHPINKFPEEDIEEAMEETTSSKKEKEEKLKKAIKESIQNITPEELEKYFPPKKSIEETFFDKSSPNHFVDDWKRRSID
jgi:hypothetical protein